MSSALSAERAASPFAPVKAATDCITVAENVEIVGMNLKQIKRLSEDGAVETINEICDGLKDFVANNPECAKTLLEELFQKILNPLSNEDFFGTEGWEHALGIED